ncbi:MAG: hypothetical protein IKS44_05385 [Bacteroidales bacterium]|nr:hypothetical protein [Bacteroidales bacterium]
MRKKLFSILALLCLTVVSAWADGTLLTTINASNDFKSGSKTFDNVVTVTFNGSVNYGGGWFYTSTSTPVTVTVSAANDDVTITSVKFFTTLGDVEDKESTYEAQLKAKNGVGPTGPIQYYQVYVNGSIIGAENAENYLTKIEVYGTKKEPAPAGTALKPDATRKVWTLDAMPAGNVELQVEYFPGMLVKPTSLVGGTMEIKGLTDTALPDGFEKDDAGNIYVEAGKTFTVKAVPATGYHLVGWSDDATIKDLEREFTMPADGSDFTVTATFSDEFELTFDDVNFKTNQNITVKVGDADQTLDQDGKLSVKSGQTVTLTAKQGYKFRSVEAKKAVKTITVTITKSDFQDGTSFTKDGVTVFAGNINAQDGNLQNDGAFTTTLGNFTSIVVTSGFSGATGDGWSNGNWTGNASTVPFSGNILGEGSITITCTIQPNN